MKIRHLLSSLSLAALLFVGCAQTVSGDATGSVDAAEATECSAEKAGCSDAEKAECSDAEKAECADAKEAKAAGCCSEGEGEAEIN